MGSDGFEPPKLEAADLQSAPFGHSGNYPSANVFPLSRRASCRIRTNDPEITNHVLWPTELKRRMGKLAISRRYDLIPLLRSSPGGIKGSMPYRTYPGAKVVIIP